jgi:hypothetical protein
MENLDISEDDGKICEEDLGDRNLEAEDNFLTRQVAGKLIPTVALMSVELKFGDVYGKPAMPAPLFSIESEVLLSGM